MHPTASSTLSTRLSCRRCRQLKHTRLPPPGRRSTPICAMKASRPHPPADGLLIHEWQSALVTAETGVTVAVEAFAAIQRLEHAGAFHVEARVVRIRHADAAVHLDRLVGDKVQGFGGARLG